MGPILYFHISIKNAVLLFNLSVLIDLKLFHFFSMTVDGEWRNLYWTICIKGNKKGIPTLVIYCFYVFFFFSFVAAIVTL